MADQGERRERKAPPSIDHMFTLKVDNITFRASVDNLKEKFSAYGEVGDVYIPRHFGSAEPRGFAFVRFLDKRDAEDAQRALDGTEMDGREIHIQEAQQRRGERPRPRSRYDDRPRGDSRGKDFRDQRRSRSRSYDRRDVRDFRDRKDHGRERGDYGRERRSRSRSREYSYRR